MIIVFFFAFSFYFSSFNFVLIFAIKNRKKLIQLKRFLLNAIIKLKEVKLTSSVKCIFLLKKISRGNDFFVSYHDS